MKTAITSTLLALSLALTAHAAQPSSAPVSAAPPTDAAIANWPAKRYGMFIHWGPVSLTGKDIAPIAVK